jgi:hypothetical protein
VCVCVCVCVCIYIYSFREVRNLLNGKPSKTKKRSFGPLGFHYMELLLRKYVLYHVS